MNLKYEGTVIRPPSEAESLILQVTLGCSDNRCDFCPAYKDKPFTVRPWDVLEDIIYKASGYYPDTRRIFLADGDAMCMDDDSWIRILNLLLERFPRLQRVGVYASPKSLRKKTVVFLKELRKLKLGIVYLGIETGDPVVYARTQKFGNPDITVEECLKVKMANIKLNTTVILGLGGKENSKEHAFNTAKVLNMTEPDHISALSLMIVKGTKLWNDQKKGSFNLIGPFEMIDELYRIITNLNDFKCLFFSNHASNYYPIEARFPAQKKEVLSQLEWLLREKREDSIKPEFFRGL